MGESQFTHWVSNPYPLAVEAHSLNHWATREVPDFIYMLNENLPCNTSNHVLKRTQLISGGMDIQIQVFI